MQTIRKLIQKIMNKISAKKIFLIFTAIVFIVVFWKFFSLLYFPDSKIILEKGDPIFELNPDIHLEQKFIANRDGLSKIEFLLRTPGPKNEDLIKIEIADEDCKNILKQGKFEKSFISSGNLYEFKFDRIPNSNNKKYCLKIESEKKKFKFFTMESQDSQFALTSQDIDAKFENKSLSMRTVYKNENIRQDLDELNQRISQYKPWFLKHYFLSTIVILFTLLSAAIVVILIML